MLIRAAIFLGAVSFSLYSQPLIYYRSVLNAASYTNQALPGGGIAQGSVFAIFGAGLGPAAPAQQPSYPLQTTLGGVSITFTQGTTTVNPIPIYVAAGQINAVMPSNAPLGSGTLQVTVNGARSNPIPVRIVTSSFGTFSANGGGFGPGIFQNYIAADNQPINSTGITATPGQIITAWGTGLGPGLNPDNQVPNAGNVATQVEIFVGGVAAKNLYSGRTPCCSGIDQVIFEVPAGAPLGCWVPVWIRTGGTAISNITTMAITSDGKGCSDSQNPLGTALVKGSKTGAYLLLHATTHEDWPVQTPLDMTSEWHGGTFSTVTPAPFPFNPVASLPPAGTCTSYTSQGDLLNAGSFPLAAPGNNLDAGSFTLTTPSGTRGLKPLIPSLNLGYLGGSLSALGILDTTIFSPGRFTVNGLGGADVKAFQAGVDIPANITWTNRDQTNNIVRSQGFTVNWTGSSAGQAVLIAGAASDVPNNASSSFLCVAPAGAGSFTVPPSALYNLPVTGLNPWNAKAVVYVAAFPLANPPTFSANGLDAGFLLYGYVNGKTVAFQ